MAGLGTAAPSTAGPRDGMGQASVVNLTRSSRPSWLERGQPYRRAKDFSAPNRRATDGRRIPPLLKLTMPSGPLVQVQRNRSQHSEGKHPLRCRVALIIGSAVHVFPPSRSACVSSGSRRLSGSKRTIGELASASLFRQVVGHRPFAPMRPCFQPEDLRRDIAGLRARRTNSFQAANDSGRGSR